MRTGLFFGSFNPIHIGHLAIANYFYSYTDIDEVWIIVTPLNPWKDGKKIMPLDERVAMAKIATSSTEFIKVSDFEKNLEQPNYTYNSLQHLKSEYPDREFVLLIGGDNFQSFAKWKYSNKIQAEYDVYAYARSEKDDEYLGETSVELFKAPLMEISSTFLRHGLAQGKNMQYFLPTGVYNYLLNTDLLEYYDE